MTTRARRRIGVDAQRERILAAAEQVFAAHDGAAIGVEHVLRAAGVSRDTFYRCFDSRDQLIEAIHGRMIAAQATFIAAHMGAGDGAGWLAAAVTDYVRSYTQRGALGRAILRAVLNPTSPLYAQGQAALDHDVRLIDAWCRRTLGVEPPPLTIRAGLSGIVQLVHHGLETGADPDAIEAAARNLARGLVYLLAEQAGGRVAVAPPLLCDMAASLQRHRRPRSPRSGRR